MQVWRRVPATNSKGNFSWSMELSFEARLLVIGDLQSIREDEIKYLRIRSRQLVVVNKPDTASIKRVIGLLRRENSVKDVNAFSVFKVVVCCSLALRMNAVKATMGANAVVAYA